MKHTPGVVHTCERQRDPKGKFVQSTTGSLVVVVTGCVVLVVVIVDVGVVDV